MKQPLSEQTVEFEIPRRRFLRDAATLATAACVSPQLLIGCEPGPGGPIHSSAAADAMDEALEMMAKLAPLSNHGPMAAEALNTSSNSEFCLPLT